MMSENYLKLQKAWMLVCLIDKYYVSDGAGGTCHIVLDDLNLGKHHIKYCMGYSIEQNDFWGETIARLLLEFTVKEREQIIERPYEIMNEIGLYL